VWFVGGVWAWGLPPSDRAGTIIGVSLAVALAGGFIAVLPAVVRFVAKSSFRFLWRPFVQRVLSPLLGASVEEPLLAVPQQPLFRFSMSVFVVTWLFRFSFPGKPGDGRHPMLYPHALSLDSATAAAWDALATALMAVGIVAIWRIASRDQP